LLNVINAVRIHIRRTRARGNPGFLHGAPLLGRRPTDLEAVATAMLDRDVIGFRPTRDGVVPLAPIALFSDPTGGTRTAGSSTSRRVAARTASASTAANACRKGAPTACTR
jgi:hypothetical protein